MTTPRYELDHVAIAAADTSEALAFLTGECSGTIMFGGDRHVVELVPGGRHGGRGEGSRRHRSSLRAG
ncbi:MAG: hypothetical protein ACKOOG_11400, partial [Actinomycetota bacterium]